MNYSSTPRLPGVDLAVKAMNNGVTLVDPDNSSAYIWAPEDVVCEVGTSNPDGD